MSERPLNVRPHVEIIRVRYGDTDQMGVVYYANYLRFFEAARVEWLRANGCNYKDVEAQGILFPVAEAHIKYRAPARYDDLLSIECVPVEVKAVSVRFGYRVRIGDQAIADGYSIHACLGTDRKLIPFPAPLRTILTGYEDPEEY